MAQHSSEHSFVPGMCGASVVQCMIRGAARGERARTQIRCRVHQIRCRARRCEHQARAGPKARLLSRAGHRGANTRSCRAHGANTQSCRAHGANTWVVPGSRREHLVVPGSWREHLGRAGPGGANTRPCRVRGAGQAGQHPRLLQPLKPHRERGGGRLGWMFDWAPHL
jgi:hypothetical protein